ncbi:MAG TPA: GNAT family protein [Terracidiphilus sp.]|nr:GNAT family protein [Terracidiphilus sp.]
MHPILRDLPMPILTPRLLIRPKQAGDGALTAAAVHETWEALHQWMRWAEDLGAFTPERMELRTRQMMASFLLREVFEFIGIESATQQPVIWCGFHDIDWEARQCDTGFWVRRSAQGRGIATEAANALLRYAFNVLGMRRVGITYSDGNHASRRIIEKLGFQFEGTLRGANLLPGGRFADRLCYARFDLNGLPDLDVRLGS